MSSSRTVDVLLLPAVLAGLALMVWQVLRGTGVAFDFHYAYWLAGRRVITGQSPYTWTQAQFRDGVAFVYPALSAVMFVPLSLLPRGAGSVASMFLCIALVPLTLRLLGIRDRRVFAVVLMWLPVYGAWQTANETMFLMLGLACLWRGRERPLVAGLIVALIVSLKPLLWPLVLWLLVTRRWRASGVALLSGLVLNLGAWAVVGFGQFASFLHAAGADTGDSWRTGWGVPALMGHFGLSFSAGLVVLLVASGALAAGVVRSAVAQRNEVRALALTVALALVSSPLLWSHYLVLLIVPLALLRPRLHWVWTMPLVMWVSPLGWTVHTWQALVAWAAAATMFVWMARQGGPGALGRPYRSGRRLQMAPVPVRSFGQEPA